MEDWPYYPWHMSSEVDGLSALRFTFLQNLVGYRIADRKVAIVTGGASGIGQAVARSLLEQSWEVYILYHSTTYNASETMPQVHFQHADVMSWASLSTAFETVFEQAGRLDCVLANAGVVNETELGSDDGDHDNDLIPIDTAPIAVNLEGVIQTSHLARHYFLRSPHRGRGATLLINASARGLYTGGFAPVYTASKAGVIHFMRSIAGSLFPSRGIRVHAICPNPVWTPIVYTNKVAISLSECFVPMEIIVSVVRLLLEETPVCDSAGKHVALAQKFGLVVEISTTGFYIRDGQEFPDAAGNLSSTLLSTLQKTQAGWP